MNGHEGSLWACGSIENTMMMMMMFDVQV